MNFFKKFLFYFSGIVCKVKQILSLNMTLVTNQSSELVTAISQHPLKIMSNFIRYYPKTAFMGATIHHTLSFYPRPGSFTEYKQQGQTMRSIIINIKKQELSVAMFDAPKMKCNLCEWEKKSENENKQGIKYFIAISIFTDEDFE
jgi:hypothetical protein